MSKSRRKFLCLDCNVDTGRIGEHYFLNNEVWFKVHNSNKGMLCISCVEKRLGRVLNKNDFSNAYVNKPIHTGQTLSNKLKERLGI